MPSIAVKSLESLLSAKQLGGTLGRLRVAPRIVSTGIPALDHQLGGGWCVGALSEVVGPRSSGRMSVLLRTLAEATTAGQVVALVDALDRFDPASARAGGVRLESVLWVRGASLTVEMARPAVVDLAIKQAVRATDLIVRAGGFGVVVLDLADMPPRGVQRVPAITWLRLAHAIEGRETVCLVISETPTGRSASGASVEVTAHPAWTGTSPQSRRFAGFTPTFTVRAARLPRALVEAG